MEALNNMNNLFKNNRELIRKSIIYGILFFSVYFILGCVYSYFVCTTGKYNLFFGTDTPRVIIDLTQITGSHIRTSVHPLFVILFHHNFYHQNYY